MAVVVLVVVVQLEEEFSVSIDVDRTDNVIVIRGMIGQVTKDSQADICSNTEGVGGARDIVCGGGPRDVEGVLVV